MVQITFNPFSISRVICRKKKTGQFIDKTQVLLFDKFYSKKSRSSRISMP